MKIAIGSDHAGFALKAELREWLEDQGHNVYDVGPFSEDSVDYPDYAFKVATVVADGRCERGILICGSGIGVSICANKVARIRAALCREPEEARLARLHNDANVLALGARFLPEGRGLTIMQTFLETDFSEEERHKRRVQKIADFEDKQTMERAKGLGVDYVSKKGKELADEAGEALEKASDFLKDVAGRVLNKK